jgi:hypothetical protein
VEVGEEVLELRVGLEGIFGGGELGDGADRVCSVAADQFLGGDEVAPVRIVPAFYPFEDGIG